MAMLKVRGTLLLEIALFWGTSLPFFFNFDWENWADAHGLLGFVVVITMIIFAFKGLSNFVWLVGSFSTGFATRRHAGPMANIAHMKEYRESKLRAMDQKQGAKLLMQTRALETPYDPDLPSGKAMEYMNSRLGALNNEDGIRYLKGEID